MKKKNKDLVERNITKKGNSTFIKIITCLLFTVIVFIALVNVEKSIMNNYKKTKVVVCKQNIGKQEDITKNNLNTYFELKEMPSNLVPKGAYKKVKDVPQGITARELVEKEVLLSNAIETKQSITKDIKDPVEASISLKSIDKAVGGILRRGDRVDISLVNNDTEKKVLIKNVFITEAMNVSGQVLSKDSKEAATIFNVIVSKKNAQLLKEVVNENNDLTLVKVNDIDR